MQTVKEVLQRSSITGSVLKLPGVQLDRKLYLDTKKQLEQFGGKWTGGKTQGFVFNHNAMDIVKKFCAEGEEQNIKKDFQYFETPPALARVMVSLADIGPKDSVLEPSAGQGAIIKAINAIHPKLIVCYCELMPLNQRILQELIKDRKIKATKVEEDFLRLQMEGFFNKIVANPPFRFNADIDHILQMFKMCKSGGRIVTVASTHWERGTGRKEQRFRDWLKDLNAKIDDVDAGTFKDAGTNIETRLIVIDKP